jgi:DNA-binding NarL/FixJ family response regulator
MARQIAAEGFLIKPLNPIKTAKAVKAILNGHTYFDESYAPISAVNSFKTAEALPGLAGNPL